MNVPIFVYFFYQVVWLKEFQTFDDKSSAINADTGINTQLTEMIMKLRNPGQELLVEKPEYKSIIQTCLVRLSSLISFLIIVKNFEHHFLYQGIPCLHNEIVMELMWGMKRLMRSLVRKEKSELPKEDRVPMSQGLQMLLSRYGFDVEPEMVSLPAAFLLLYTLSFGVNILQ
jgi:nucleolar protein 58